MDLDLGSHGGSVQPFIPVRLTRANWRFIDAIAAAALLLFMTIYSTHDSSKKA